MSILSNTTLKYSRLTGIFSGVVIALSFTVMIYGAYLRWWPMEAVEYDTKIFPIASSHIPVDCDKTKDGLYIFNPGDIVPLLIKGNKLVNVHAQIMPRFIDGTVTLLPDITARRPKGRFEEIALTYKVPRSATNGLHYFEFTVNYDVNPLRTLSYHVRSVPFWVERKSSDQSCVDCKYKKNKRG